ncbi:MAG TPA: MGMT family protein, partial [Gemmatimonadaceae bacterium]|nr:MGMT family protein [Gemmatimonadaceae bacterium]
YLDVARAVNRPKATRAVAQACGANPVAVVVPCHRVVMSDGSIGGYSGLPGVKQALLSAEGAAVATGST